jgi:hypothetical protein
VYCVNPLGSCGAAAIVADISVGVIGVTSRAGALGGVSVQAASIVAMDDASAMVRIRIVGLLDCCVVAARPAWRL